MFDKRFVFDRFDHWQAGYKQKRERTERNVFMSAKTRQDCERYQAICLEKAFALPFILCTVSVRQSILTGILIVWLLLFCQLLRNSLREAISERSCRAAVSIAAAAVSCSLFLVTDYAAGLRDIRQAFSFALYGSFVGLLTADAVWDSRQASEPSGNCLLFRSALLWAMMIAAGIIREFLAYGSILDVKLAAFPFQSAVFAKPAFGLIFSAFSFALLNTGKPTFKEPLCPALYPIAALLVLCPPALGHGNAWIFQAAGVFTVFLFHASVRYRMAYSDAPFSLLTESLMASGFFYMIL